MRYQRRMRLVGEEGDAGPEPRIRVAFASSDREQVDQHFGSADSLVLYEVDPERWWLREVVEFGELAQDGQEDKLRPKLETLSGCVAVFCQAVGSSAIRQLLAVGVQPVKVSENKAVEELLIDLRQELAQGPSGWLAKALRQHRPADPERFDQMEAEGWDG